MGIFASWVWYDGNIFFKSILRIRTEKILSSDKIHQTKKEIEHETNIDIQTLHTHRKRDLHGIDVHVQKETCTKYL